MKAKVLDVVKLRDGREGTILELWENKNAGLLEICDEKGRAIDEPVINLDDIEEITFSYESTL